MNLLDEHNKRLSDEEKELILDDTVDEIKRRRSKYGDFDADYLKWTNCFKRKSVLWDD